MTTLQSLPAGTELVGDYRVERVLGAGGFGITYLAEEPALARKVTIKEYFPNDFATRGDDHEAVPRSRSSKEDYQWGLDRFIDEAQTLAKFDHRNIVRVHRYFRANNTGYMVLHFEEGQSLKSWLRGLGRAPRQNELDRILAPLLDALPIIHAADFLHRDIAPDNIIIRKDGSPVLIDFGSARGEIAQHTRTISALVKPGYSPYEQYSETGKQQGPWTDIYALAATLFHAVTGKRPPDAPSRVVKDELKPAREAAISTYRTGFLKAIDRGLAVDIDKRPQSIAAWRGDLLAPDPEPKRWFGRSPAQPGDQFGLDPEGGEARTEPMMGDPRPTPGPPPPDAPGRRGQFADYVDGLKRPGDEPGGAKAEPESSPPGAAHEPGPGRPDKATAKTEPLSPTEADAARARPGLAGLFARKNRQTVNPARRPAESAPGSAPEGPAAATPPTPAAANASPGPAARPAARGALLPIPETPLRPAERRKPPKPKPIRSGRKSWWRPLAFRLLIGLGIASLAVAYQQRMPQFELRSLGMVSSAPRTVETPAASAATTSDAKRASRRINKNPAGADDKGQRENSPPASLLVRRFKAHMPGTTQTRFANGGKWIITTGHDGVLKVWDTESAGNIRTLEMDDGPATALAVSGNRALTGHSEGSVALWDLVTGAKLAAFKHNEVRIWSVAFDAANRRVFAASHDWSAAVWEIGTPSAPLHVFKGHDNAVQALAYSAATNMLATGGADRTVQLWNMGSLSRLRSYRRDRDFVTALRFSPDGDVVVAGLLNGRITAHSTRSRRRLRRFAGHDGAISRVRFLDDGNHLLSFSKDGTARLWNMRRSRAMRTYGSSGAALHDGDVSPDHERMITANAEGVITIWRIGRLRTRPRRR